MQPLFCLEWLTIALATILSKWLPSDANNRELAYGFADFVTGFDI